MASRLKRPKQPPAPLDIAEMAQDPGFRGMLSFLEVSPQEKVRLLQQRAAVDAASVIPFPSAASDLKSASSLLPKGPETTIVDGLNTTVFDAPEATIVNAPTTTVFDAPEATRIDCASVDPLAVVDEPRMPVVAESAATEFTKTAGVDDSTTTVVNDLRTTVVASVTPQPVNPPATVVDGPPRMVVAGTQLWYTEGKEGIFPGSRIRPIARAQDALTHAEESVYDVLWGPKNQEKDQHRTASLGYDAVAKAARVTKRNAKLIIERLIYKGFVKIESLPDPLRRIPTKYTVFSHHAALEHMTGSKRFYVVRTGNGVLFAHPLDVGIADLTTTVVGG